MRFFVTLDGKEHRIVFKHGFNQTSAIMSIRVNGVWLPIGENGAACSPVDQYNKWFGRKLALTRLTQNIQNKEHRKIIWNAYFEAVATHLLSNNYVNQNTNANIVSSYNKIVTAWKEAINPKCNSY